MNLTEFLSKPGNTQTALAEKLNVSQGLVYQWASGKRPISPAQCVQIERVTDGEVTRKDLRPTDWAEIWPELVKAA
jgi:DNA-binding transcriptional regulator YdaS (Cro superfamily)